MCKVLVLYVFHIYNNRVKNFIKKCIFNDENTDFILISNNKNNTIDILLPDNVKILYRDNIGYDFGGWSDALLINNLYENYDKFIFVNSSVAGPFIPSYCNQKWTYIYRWATQRDRNHTILCSAVQINTQKGGRKMDVYV
jgi:hypothetical protein